MALKFNRGGGQHADILQTLHVGQIRLTKRHKEADALDAGDVLRQRLNLFVVQQVQVLLTDLIEVIFALDGHGRNLDPVAVLPVRTGRGNFAQVDFGVEVGGKRIAVVAAVAVEDVNGVDLVEQVLLGISAVRLCDTRVKA